MYDQALDGSPIDSVPGALFDGAPGDIRQRGVQIGPPLPAARAGEGPQVAGMTGIFAGERHRLRRAIEGEARLGALGGGDGLRPEALHGARPPVDAAGGELALAITQEDDPGAVRLPRQARGADAAPGRKVARRAAADAHHPDVPTDDAPVAPGAGEEGEPTAIRRPARHRVLLAGGAERSGIASSRRHGDQPGAIPGILTWAVGNQRHEAVAIGRLVEFPHVDALARDAPRRARLDVHDPQPVEPRLLVEELRVVLLFFTLSLLVGVGVGHQARDAAAVRRPAWLGDVPRGGPEQLRLAAQRVRAAEWHQVEARLAGFFTVADEQEVPAIGRPARRGVGAVLSGQRPRAAAVQCHRPHPAARLRRVRLVRLSHHPRQPAAIRRKLRIGDEFQIQQISQRDPGRRGRIGWHFGPPGA